MKDTGFVVPREKWSRRAGTYGFDGAGRLIARASGPGRSFLAERPETMTYVSGGQGLWSTVDDYLTFARLLIGSGAVAGTRLLQPATLSLMTSNRLSETQRTRAEMFGMPLFGAGHGYGMGVAVVLDPANATPTLCGGGVGAVGWPGGFGGWWQADPNDSSVLIFLTHNLVEVEQLAQGIGLGVYGAISQFYGRASGMVRQVMGG
jgi:CubicO group peptidase (beta-lactamase class C family)